MTSISDVDFTDLEQMLPGVGVLGEMLMSGQLQPNAFTIQYPEVARTFTKASRRLVRSRSPQVRRFATVALAVATVVNAVQREKFAELAGQLAAAWEPIPASLVRGVSGR